MMKMQKGFERGLRAQKGREHVTDTFTSWWDAWTCWCGLMHGYDASMEDLIDTVAKRLFEIDLDPEKCR